MKKSFSRITALLLAMLLTLSAAPLSAFADGGDGDEPPPDSSPIALSIALSPETLTLEKGKTAELTAKVTDADDNLVEDTTVTWSSSNEAVATVDEQGTVTAVAAGTATITATATVGEGEDAVSQYATCTVTVTEPVPTVETVTLDFPSLTLEQAATQQLTATKIPQDAAETITWSSANTAIATVNENGLVTAVSPGQTTVKATAGTVSATCEVTVSGVVLSSTTLQLVSGNSADIGTEYHGAATDAGLRWEWSTSNAAVAQVTSAGKVTAIGEGTATIKLESTNGVYAAACTVTVRRNEAGLVRASIDGGAPLDFGDIESTLKNRGQDLMGASVSYVTGLSVPTTAGTLYYQYNSPADTGAGVGSEKYYVDGTASGVRRFSDVTFVPRLGFSGEATIAYTGVTVSGQTYVGEIVVTVAQTDLLTYASENGEPITFSPADFSEYSRIATGRDISHISFSLPASRYGTLYYNYTSDDRYGSVVKSSDLYYRTKSPYISSVSFVPAAGYTGTFTMTYTGYDTSNTRFTGEIRIRVSRRDGDGALTYKARSGTRLTFDVDDFSDASYDVTGYELNYVRFTLPASSRGVLYYNTSTRVSESTSYYRTGSSSTRLIKNISFVPDKDFTGTVTIRFTGYNTRGTSFTGTITINVSEDGSDILRYSARSGVRLSFDVDDFSDASHDETGYELNYVRFTLPTSSRGVLYYNTSTRVSESTSYYRTGSSSTRLIKDISFVPDKDFTGTVTIRFTGYNTRGTSFSGTITISVSGDGSEILRYNGFSGVRLHFDVDDFSDASYDETGYELNYVRFTLPASSRGVLYHDTSTRVSESTSYYRTGSSSTRLIKDISFVPDEDFTGTVTIRFTGYNTRGTSFSRDVRVEVTRPKAAEVSYYTSGAAVIFQSADFASACAQALSGTLHGVRLTLPDPYAGKLYYSYSGPAQYEGLASTSTYYASSSPYLSRVSFVPRAGYSGTVHLSFTATDNKGASCTGTVRITVTQSSYSGAFTDMGSYGWAASASDFLHRYSIVSGTGAGRYSPGAQIKRGDFILMLSRAYDLKSAGAASFRDVPQSSYYAEAIASAKAQGIATGFSDGSFRPESSISRQDAALMLQKCMLRAGVSGSDGTAGDLAAFSDRGQVASYALGALSGLVRQGILSGNGAGQLMPASTLTRAEMAVILHRALTL